MPHPIQKPILIAGGGLASLLLAQALRRAAIPFRIYERDHSFSFRAQGYRLRLSSLGLDAIENVLGKDDFSAFWNICSKTGGGGMTALDALTGSELATGPKPEAKSSGPPPGLQSRDGKVVGISRGAMREHFLRGCESSVELAHEVTGYEITPTGVRAFFADGTKSTEGEMLVGGDGLRSSVAKQLSQGKLGAFDTGARIIHGQAPVSAFDGIGEGVWRIVDKSRSGGEVFIITNVRPGDGEATFGWSMGAQPGVIDMPSEGEAIIGTSAASIARSLAERWHPRVKPLVEQMVDTEAAFWKVTCSNPTGVPEWQNEKRVTVIGDAVHSMTPAGGLGANTAMRDSALLGELLADSDGSIDGLTEAYEKEMRVYASEAVKESYGMAKGQMGIEINEKSPTV